MSVPKVDQCYSLLRTYRMFRTLGLRQLVVIDIRNRVVGIITRKDLMQFNMQENWKNSSTGNSHSGIGRQRERQSPRQPTSFQAGFHRRGFHIGGSGIRQRWRHHSAITRIKTPLQMATIERRWEAEPSFEQNNNNQLKVPTANGQLQTGNTTTWF